MPDLRSELESLAADFETLSDPARDDMTFMYSWAPPDWYSPEQKPILDADGFHKEWGELDLDRVIEIAAVLRQAANVVASFNIARPDGDATLIFIIPADMGGWIGRLGDDGAHDTVVDFAPYPGAVLHSYHVAPGVYTIRVRHAGTQPMESTIAVEAGDTRNVGLTTRDTLYAARDTTDTMRPDTEHDQEAD